MLVNFQRAPTDEFTKGLMRAANELPKRVKTPAKRILSLMASYHGVDAPVYKEVAPLLLKSMNAGEVLSKLIELGSDPKSLQVVAHELVELARIEAGDVVKLYRGRRDGIRALQTLQEKALESWGGPKFERELHRLLKDNPWLIETEFSRFLTSDKPMGDVAKKLDFELGIDSALPSDYDPEKDLSRPDLVALLVSPYVPSRAVVLELKSPNLPLDNDHLGQLESYIDRARKVLAKDYGQPKAHVHGYLIGNLPLADAKVPKQTLLLSKMEKWTPSHEWEVIPIAKMLERAKQRHLEILDAVEQEEKGLDDELSTE